MKISQNIEKVVLMIPMCGLNFTERKAVLQNIYKALLLAEEGVGAVPKNEEAPGSSSLSTNVSHEPSTNGTQQPAAPPVEVELD